MSELTSTGLIDFFYSYGLFFAKTATIILLGVIGLALFASLVSHRSKNKEEIEIEKINDHFDDLKDALEKEVYSKEEFKQISKEKKKQEKEEKKAAKKKAKERKKNKEKENTEASKRIYVINFYGDMNASEVDSIRESITAILQIATKDDEVLVILESPGGIVHNYGLASSQLQRIREREIPLTVAVDLVAASGGYMMACVANKIIAAPFAVVGSIGVVAQLPNFHRLLDKNKIDIEHHTAGEYKRTLTMLGENTDKGREKFCEELEDTHKLFKDFVATNRPQLNIDAIATGEHWYATQALEMNLIDAIKTSDDYLLEKAQNEWDIYEVNYVFNETIKDKVQNMIFESTAKLFNKAWQKLNFPSLLI